MELTDNDRQRIEQEAKKFYANWGCCLQEWIKGAEYEHKYQREQQAELRNKVIEECIIELTMAGFNVDCAETAEDRENAEILFKNLEDLKTK